MLSQKEQHEKWLRVESGIEYPTHVKTLQQPRQVKRIQWLKEHCTGKILDIGCNWGYISDKIGATQGIDINPENIKTARTYFPSISFEVRDIVEEAKRIRAYRPNEFDTIVLADILEHIEWDNVFPVLSKAVYWGSKVLITLPIRQSNKCALCFKHKWIPNEERIELIKAYVEDRYKCSDRIEKHRKVKVSKDKDFAYIEITN